MWRRLSSTRSGTSSTRSKRALARPPGWAARSRRTARQPEPLRDPVRRQLRWGAAWPEATLSLGVSPLPLFMLLCCTCCSSAQGRKHPTHFAAALAVICFLAVAARGQAAASGANAPIAPYLARYPHVAAAAPAVSTCRRHSRSTLQLSSSNPPGGPCIAPPRHIIACSEALQEQAACWPRPCACSSLPEAFPARARTRTSSSSRRHESLRHGPCSSSMAC